MGLTKLGAYIEQSDARNTDLRYGADAVVGLSTQKQMIDTKADLSGVSLASYKLFRPQEFAYVPDTSRRDDKMALAFNATDTTYLVSSISIVFRVADSESLLADYLYVYFNRPEFDRYARFHSWGSARETFSWEDMCDIEIDLPPLLVQQKYVAVYRAMCANQQSYERGLEDLKFVCDAVLDQYKHTAPRKAVGDILREVDVRNDDGTISNVQGINIEKKFMPSVADTTSVNLARYKVVQRGQFAYSGMQTGRDECIRIALYDGGEPIVISPAYTVLEVSDGDVLPAYVMMYFSRAESDRRGWFMSDASIRANLDLSRFFETEIPIPDITVQESIANIYRVYKERQAINAQLKEQIKSICPILVRGACMEAHS